MSVEDERARRGRPTGSALIFALISTACGGNPEYLLGRIAPETELPEGGSEAGSEPSAPDATADGGECDPGAPRADYAFSGSGLVLFDAAGGPAGTIVGGAQLDDSNELVLDGVDDYVDLPNDLITGLDEVTIAVWVRHLGGPAYTRVFDFGNGSDGEDPAEGLGTVGSTYLSVTPGTGFVPRRLAALVSRDGAQGEIAAATDARLDDALHLVLVAVTSTTLGLFYDGALIALVPSSVPLADIENVNNWLGRSQYDQDPYFHGAYAGLRVFDHALDPCAVRTVYALGPTG